MTPGAIRTLLFSAPIVFVLYRRARAQIGRQPFRVGRARGRVVLLSAAGVLVFLPHLADPKYAGAVAGGAALGVLVGFYALRHTTFELTPAGSFYTPNLYIGLAVTALLIARIAYQLSAVDLSGPAMWSRRGSFQTPTTVGFFFILAGYYVAYYAGLLRRNRPSAPAAGAPDARSGSSPTAASPGQTRAANPPPPRSACASHCRPGSG